MITVKRLLQAKRDEIWSTTPETSVFDALILMAKKNIGALMVLESGKLRDLFGARLRKESDSERKVFQGSTRWRDHDGKSYHCRSESLYR